MYPQAVPVAVFVPTEQEAFLAPEFGCEHYFEVLQGARGESEGGLPASTVNKLSGGVGGIGFTLLFRFACLQVFH